MKDEEREVWRGKTDRVRDVDGEEVGEGGLRKRKYPCYKPSTHYRQRGGEAAGWWGGEQVCV